MHPFRGIVMLVAAGIAFYKACELHGGRNAYAAAGLGLLALGIAAWHLRGVWPTRGERR